MGLPKKLRINVWLNADQLPVKMSCRSAKLGSFEAHFSEYGEPVQVSGAACQARSADGREPRSDRPIWSGGA